MKKVKEKKIKSVKQDNKNYVAGDRTGRERERERENEKNI